MSQEHHTPNTHTHTHTHTHPQKKNSTYTPQHWDWTWFGPSVLGSFTCGHSYTTHHTSNQHLWTGMWTTADAKKGEDFIRFLQSSYRLLTGLLIVYNCCKLHSRSLFLYVLSLQCVNACVCVLCQCDWLCASMWGRVCVCVCVRVRACVYACQHMDASTLVHVNSSVPGIWRIQIKYLTKPNVCLWEVCTLTLCILGSSDKICLPTSC